MLCRLYWAATANGIITNPFPEKDFKNLIPKIPIGHNAHHKEEGLSLLATRERNDAMWELHSISKYLAQLLETQLKSDQLIELLKKENVLTFDETGQALFKEMIGLKFKMMPEIGGI